MDYYQGVVFDYLQLDRSVFLNVECCIQLKPGRLLKGEHWICDAVAVNLRRSEARLCEVTYAKDLGALSRRLTAWAANWPSVREALARDCNVPMDWRVQPWLFVPSDRRALLDRKLKLMAQSGGGTGEMPLPKVTHMEEVAPWIGAHWDEHKDTWADDE